jgi:hypothetical protein
MIPFSEPIHLKTRKGPSGELASEMPAGIEREFGKLEELDAYK